MMLDKFETIADCIVKRTKTNKDLVTCRTVAHLGCFFCIQMENRELTVSWNSFVAVGLKYGFMIKF